MDIGQVLISRWFLNAPLSPQKPVKMVSDYMTDGGVRTDVIIFNRKHSSEFDIEREQLKDELLVWNERYKKRMEDKMAHQHHHQWQKQAI